MQTYSHHRHPHPSTGLTSRTSGCFCFLMLNGYSYSSYFVYYPKVTTLRSGLCYCKSVCRLYVVCNARAPYSGGWNVRQYFFAILYLSHLLTYVQNFTDIVPHPTSGAINTKGVAKKSDGGAIEGYNLISTYVMFGYLISLWVFCFYLTVSSPSCGRLRWLCLLVRFWAHVNIFVSYRIVTVNVITTFGFVKYNVDVVFHPMSTLCIVQNKFWSHIGCCTTIFRNAINYNKPQENMN